MNESYFEINKNIFNELNEDSNLNESLFDTSEKSINDVFFEDTITEGGAYAVPSYNQQPQQQPANNNKLQTGLNVGLGLAGAAGLGTLGYLAKNSYDEYDQGITDQIKAAEQENQQVQGRFDAEHKQREAIYKDALQHGLNHYDQHMQAARDETAARHRKYDEQEALIHKQYLDSINNEEFYKNNSMPGENKSDFVLRMSKNYVNNHENLDNLRRQNFANFDQTANQIDAQKNQFQAAYGTPERVVTPEEQQYHKQYAEKMGAIKNQQGVLPWMKSLVSGKK